MEHAAPPPPAASAGDAGGDFSRSIDTFPRCSDACCLSRDGGARGRGERIESGREGGERRMGGQREMRTVCPNGMEGGWKRAKW
jgi:hypothetical protein